MKINSIFGSKEENTGKWFDDFRETFHQLSGLSPAEYCPFSYTGQLIDNVSFCECHDFQSLVNR